MKRAEVDRLSMECAFHDGSYANQGRSVLAFNSGCQIRRRVRRTDQHPAVREGESDSIEIDQLSALGIRPKVLDQGIDDPELVFFGNRDFDLGCRDLDWDVCEEVRALAIILSHDFKGQESGEESIVEAVSLVIDTDMAGEFPGKDRSRLTHFFLDDGVAGFAQDRFSTCFDNCRLDIVGAFDVEDDFSAGDFFQKVTGKSQKQKVCRDLLTVFIDQSDPVRVPIETKPTGVISFSNQITKSLHVFGDLWVGKMVGKRSIRLCVEGIDFDPQFFKEGQDDWTCGAVAAVDGDLESFRKENRSTRDAR